MHHTLTRLRGLGRSLAMYYWPPGSLARLTRFYGRFVRPGDLCFDIGAHVGNRSLAFARLGARVVAVEPQPDFARFLRHLLKGRSGVVLEEVAVAAAPGRVELHLSPATPTVSTASAAFIDGVAAIPSFAGVRWERRVLVPATTLDLLVARHGLPDFLKLDIEGLEEEALAGLTHSPKLLSFEFLAGRTASAGRCLDRLEAIGSWAYNISIGESLELEWPDFVPRARLDAWLAARAGEDFSGDIYARLEGEGR
ncbi:MAG: FkbM family methyltransferase [Geminicoccaceae bacterium]